MSDLALADRERFELAREQFARAWVRLQEVTAMDETPIVRDALIQRFEFTYETAWKSLYYWLRSEGEQVPRMVRPVLRAAFTAQLIEDPQLWEEIKDCRDQTSHTYDEARAIRVADFVRRRAVGAFDALQRRLAAL
jgi:nucleotidyltransferase substrate binding protein (TIGR01987 family)